MTTCTSTTDTTWTRGSTEYLKYKITADVALDAQPVYFTFNRTDFLPAEWTGSDTETSPGVHERVARRLITDADLPDGFAAEVWIRITDSPEIPLVSAGSITIS